MALALGPPEFGVEPIEAWRVWRLRRSASGELALVSAGVRCEWVAREALPARCQTERHSGDVPAEGCVCGYYALPSPRHLFRFGLNVAVVGTVALWGRVIEHWAGYRAEFAYPQRVRLACGRCLRAGRQGRPVVAVTLDDGEVLAACRFHSVGVRRRGDVRRASEVEAELLARYGIEVLPIVLLPKLPWRRQQAAALVARSKKHVGRVLIAALVAVWLAHYITGSTETPRVPSTPVVKTGGSDRSASAAGGPAASAADRSSHPARHHRRPDPVRFRALCGRSVGRKIVVADCGAPDADWISAATYEAGFRPDCLHMEVVRKLPDGRHRCWFNLAL